MKPLYSSYVWKPLRLDKSIKDRTYYLILYVTHILSLDFKAMFYPTK